MDTSPPTPPQYPHLALNFGTLLPPEMPTSARPQLRAPQQAPQRADPGRPQGWRSKQIPLGLQVLVSAETPLTARPGRLAVPRPWGRWKPLPGTASPAGPAPLSTCCFHLGNVADRSLQRCMGSLPGVTPWGRSDSAANRPTVGFSVSAGRGVPKVLTWDAVRLGDSKTRREPGRAPGPARRLLRRGQSLRGADTPTLPRGLSSPRSTRTLLQGLPVKQSALRIFRNPQSEREKKRQFNDGE